MSRSSGRGPKRRPAKSRPEAACTVQHLVPALVLSGKDVVASVLDCGNQSQLQICQTAANAELASWTSLLYYWACLLRVP